MWLVLAVLLLRIPPYGCGSLMERQTNTPRYPCVCCVSLQSILSYTHCVPFRVTYLLERWYHVLLLFYLRPISGQALSCFFFQKTIFTCSPGRRLYKRTTNPDSIDSSRAQKEYFRPATSKGLDWYPGMISRHLCHHSSHRRYYIRSSGSIFFQPQISLGYHF